MGSVDKAVITGFICRLCSEMNRFVVHIYGEEGQRLQLAHKINFYLPISVSPHDPLPKTVCLRCIESLEAQHDLMEQFKQARQRFNQALEEALQLNFHVQREERRRQTSGSSEPKDQPQGESSHSRDQDQSTFDNRVGEATTSE